MGQSGKASETHTHTQGLSRRVEENPLGAGGQKWKWVTQSCPTLCDPMGYTVDGILQTRILEWGASPFSRGLPNPGIKPRSPSSWPRTWTGVSHIAGRFFTNWAITCRQGKGQEEELAEWWRVDRALGTGRLSTSHCPVRGEGRAEWRVPGE